MHHLVERIAAWGRIVSKYFKFKTPESLAHFAEDMELDVRVSDDLSPLLNPITIGGRLVGNRLVIQPMEGCDGTADGSPDELTFRRYERFGAGGAKLIWGEAAAVVPEGRANTRQLVIDEAHASGMAKLSTDCRRAHRQAWGDDSDLLIGIQLTHSGRYSVPQHIIAQHDPVLDPRTVVDKATKQTVGPETPLISDDELDRLQEAYVSAARVAHQAGFDFIDIKQCHKYLLNELLASKTRPGKYGGAYENRTRFVREVVAKVRDALPNLMIATRMNIFDGVPFNRGPDEGAGIPCNCELPLLSTWGTREADPHIPDLSEPIRLIGELKELGVSLFNLTLGNPYANPHLLRPFEYAPPDAYQTPEHPLIGVDRHFRLTAEVQAAYPHLPIVGSGYSWLQAWMFHAGAANLRDGRVSLVGVGRGALSHPDFGGYVIEGKALDPKRTCRTFSDCTALMRSKHNALGQFATGCPPFDKEVYGPIYDEAMATK